jgi:amino acid transporter
MNFYRAIDPSPIERVGLTCLGLPDEEETVLVLERIRRVVLGSALDPLDQSTRHRIALIPLLAWVGLGADGLSSSCYGPEEAFKALGPHMHLGLYLAVATSLTVFIIAAGYNQVIELFPTGGGGYRVATALLGPHAGLVSGCALLVDYVLTITTSLASGVDAFFSLLPVGAQAFKLATELILILAMTTLNFRGMKESVAVLAPIFLGFVVTHVLLIIYGVAAQGEHLPSVVPDTLHETSGLAQQMGWLFVIALFLRSFSLGGGTYTGLEAVSNNVGMIAEPRVRNGIWTMFLMAASLSFTAGGIVLLYMLWHAQPVEGQTLNAVVFRSILGNLGWGSTGLQNGVLAVVLALEAGLLLVGAQTGFLDGPTVMSNMAGDYWTPRHFRDLSSRLVRQNGIVVMGVASLLILAWTKGSVDLLVVLYSINVFLTFSLSLLGMCVYWWRHHDPGSRWMRRLLLSALGLAVTASVLVITIIEKFTEGGWLTIIVTGVVIVLCLLTKRHYDETRKHLREADMLYAGTLEDVPSPAHIDPAQPTAVLMVGKHRGASMHALLWVLRLFPGNFQNFVFLAVGEVDAQSFEGQEHLRRLRQQVEETLRYCVCYCHRRGLAATYVIAFGTDPVEEFTKLSNRVMSEYPNSVAFASSLIFARANVLTRWLHNQTPLILQRRLHLADRHMVLVPMKIG